MITENKPFQHLLPSHDIHEFMIMDRCMTVLDPESIALLPSYKGPLPDKMPMEAFDFIVHRVMQLAYFAGQGLRPHDEIVVTVSKSAYTDLSKYENWSKSLTYKIIDAPRFNLVDNAFTESENGMYEDVMVEIKKIATFKITLRIKRPEFL